MAEPTEPAPAPPPDDGNLVPWERQQQEKRAGSLPGGAATGWHDAGRKEKSKRSQIVLAVAIFFGLAGLLVAMLLWLREPTPDIELLALPVSQYRHIEWGSNPTADLDADELLKQFRQAGGRASADQEVNNLRTLLTRIRSRDNPRAPLIVFVSALAIVRDDKAYILPGDAPLGDADAASTWVPFADVLAAVAASNAEQKALVVDLARTPADPFHGPLHDDVAAQIDREIAAFDPKFPVLASCSPGERSLVIPELRLSAFAAFLSEGLRGEADGYRPGETPDGKLTFAELADFTIARVSQWADAVPDARQMPKRYGPDGAGFILFRERSRAAPPSDETPAAPPPAPGYPAELRDGWKQRDAHRDLGTLLAPDLLLDLESRLLRAEERYLLGLDFEDPRQDPAWRTAVARLESRTALWRPVRPACLAELRAGRKPPPAELGAVLDKWLRLRFPPVDDAGKPLPVSPADLEKHESEVLEKWFAGDQVIDAFAHFWSKLADDPSPTQEKVVNIVTLLYGNRFRERLDATNELLLLKRIATAKLPSFAYPDAVRALLQSEQEFGEAVAATGGPLPEGFRRVRPRFTDADAKKRSAEDAIFKPRTTSDEIEAAREQLKSAANQLKSLRTDANKLRAAHRAAAEVAAQLHAVLPGVVAWDRPSSESWLATARIANDLAARIAVEGPFEARDIEAIDALARKLRGAASALTLANPGQLKKYEEDAMQRPQSSSLTELQKLLAGSALAADERAAIAAGYRKVSAYRYFTERAKFDREHIRMPAEHLKWEDPFQRSQRRAGFSTELLRMTGSLEGDKLGLAVRTASTDLAKWQALGDRLNAAWFRETPAALESEVRKNRWLAVERILRAAPPRLDGFDRERGFGELFRTEEVERRKWLAERFGEYGKLRASVPGAGIFYAALVEDCDRPLAKGGR